MSILVIVSKPWISGQEAVSIPVHSLVIVEDTTCIHSAIWPHSYGAAKSVTQWPQHCNSVWVQLVTCLIQGSPTANLTPKHLSISCPAASYWPGKNSSWFAFLTGKTQHCEKLMSDVFAWSSVWYVFPKALSSWVVSNTQTFFRSLSGNDSRPPG